MSKDDENIWSEFCKNITPIKTKVKIGIKTKKIAKITKPAQKIRTEISFKNLPLKKKDAIEASLDLHGLFHDEAYNLLNQFILEASKRRYKKILVITGKGLRSENNMQRLLPFWLENIDSRNLIKSHKLALPKDGGSGAYYIYLNK